MKKYLPIIVPVLLVALVLVPAAASALNLGNEYIQNFGETIGAGEADVGTAVGRIINIVLSILGLIATVLIIVGGFQWMMSGGNEEKIGEAKKLMMAGVVGLIIVVLAYAIANFLISRIQSVAD